MTKECRHCKTSFDTRTKRVWCYECLALKDARAKHLLTQFDMTRQMFDAMYFDQDGKCLIAICNREATQVDHDHKCCPGRKSCGKCVRGLLCDPCNRNLGMVENSQWLEASLDYLYNYSRG